jgi:HK97 gp10 family phage protein
MTYQQDRMALDSAKRLSAALLELGTEVATKVGVKADREAANVLKTMLITAAPFNPDSGPKMRRKKDGTVTIVDYGHLRGNIKVRRQRARTQGYIVYNVTTSRAFWGMFLEFGTVKMAPHPWYRPAVEQAKGDMLAAQINGLDAGIAAAARAAARRNRTILPNGRSA